MKLEMSSAYDTMLSSNHDIWVYCSDRNKIHSAVELKTYMWSERNY